MYFQFVFDTRQCYAVSITTFARYFFFQKNNWLEEAVEESL